MVRVSFLAFYYALNCAFVAEPFSIILTLPLFLLCCVNMSTIKQPFVTAEDMIWLITYLFFVIGPCQAIGDGYIGKASGPVAGVSFTNEELAKTSILVFLFFFIATITKFLLKGPPLEQPAANFRFSSEIAIPLLLLSVGAFLAFVFAWGGIANVLANRASKVRQATSDIATAFLALQIITTLLIAVIYRTASESRLPAAALFLALPLLAVSQNPLNAPRYFLLASWLPILFVAFKGRVRSAPFYLSVFFGIVVVMPIFSITSRFGSSFSEAYTNVNVEEAFFHLPYIDVFDMLAYEIKYLATADFFYGQKTLGVLLFFIPRSIWPDKATLLAVDMGTGLLDEKIAGTSNLSLFFAGEFYADFGIAGVIVGACLTTLALLWLGARRPFVNGFDVNSFVFTAAIPILIRGPLGANAALSTCEFIFLAFLCYTFGDRVRTVQRYPASKFRRSKSKA